MNTLRPLPHKLLSLGVIFATVYGCAHLDDHHATNGTHKNHSGHGSCDIQTIKSGLWSQDDLWNLQRTPQTGEQVCILHRTTYDQTPADAIDLTSVMIKDRLVFVVDRSTQLRVQNLHVTEGGLLQIGQETRPLPKEHLAEIVFVHQALTQGDLSPHELGLVAMGGRVELHGRRIDRIVRLDLEWDRGQDRAQGERADRARQRMKRARWDRGDELLFPAMTFERDETLGNETRQLMNLDHQLIELDQPLTYPHKKIYQEELRVANLSANIVLRSERADLKRRGHVMFMQGPSGKCGQVNISGTRFDHLGRTDKLQVTADDNQQMMYALHFHRCGALRDQASHVVRDSVVVNTPGWGFVNHGSDVIFEGNVVYDFVGAGFVAEVGDERGVFSRNLSVGGDGVRLYEFRRLYLGDPERIRQADLGFHGDGYWIASPFIEVRDNASIGNHGNGFVWYTTGIDARFVGEKLDGGSLSLTVPASFLTSDEMNKLGYRRPKRYWADNPRKFLVSDLPIFSPVMGNYAAANFVGLRVRYGRSLNFAFLGKFWSKYQPDEQIKGLNQPSDRSVLYAAYSRFGNTKLQNNEIGVHTSYSARLHLKDFKIEADQSLKSKPIPDGDEFEQNETTGIEMNHNSNWGHHLENVLVKGYEVGERATSVERAVEIRERVRYRDCDVDRVVWEKGQIRSKRR